MLNALLATFSCVYTEIMSNIISFFQKVIKGVGIRAGGLENFSKINKRGGDDYSGLESIESLKRLYSDHAKQYLARYIKI